MGKTNNNGTVRKKKVGSLRSIFMHADFADLCFMFLGLIGAIGDGFSTPLVLLITSRLMNNIGGTTTSREDNFLQSIDEVYIAL